MHALEEPLAAHTHRAATRTRARTAPPEAEAESADGIEQETRLSSKRAPSQRSAAEDAHSEWKKEANGSQDAVEDDATQEHRRDKPIKKKKSKKKKMEKKNRKEKEKEND